MYSILSVDGERTQSEILRHVIHIRPNVFVLIKVAGILLVWKYAHKNNNYEFQTHLHTVLRPILHITNNQIMNSMFNLKDRGPT